MHDSTLIGGRSSGTYRFGSVGRGNIVARPTAETGTLALKTAKSFVLKEDAGAVV